MVFRISVLVLPLNVTTSRDSYAWNYRELAIPFALGDSLITFGTGTPDPWICNWQPQPLNHPCNFNICRGRQLNILIFAQIEPGPGLHKSVHLDNFY